MHEHLFIDFSKFFQPPSTNEEVKLAEEPLRLDNLHWIQYNSLKNKSNLVIDDSEIVASELLDLKRAGGSLVVDATTVGIARNPLKMQLVSAASGIHVVAGAGSYVNSTLPEAMHSLTVRELEMQLLNELHQGIDNTHVRAGIIGELGTSWPISETERKVLQAAASAARKAGVMINVHPGRDERAPLECIKILTQSGSPELLSRVVMSHIDRTLFEPEQQRAVAATGCVLEFDLFGSEISYYTFSHSKKNMYMPNDEQRLEWIQRLCEQGYGSQIVVSHDIYTKHRLKRFGGHGFAHLLTNIAPRMKARGMSAEQVGKIFNHTPVRLLTIE